MNNDERDRHSEQNHLSELPSSEEVYSAPTERPVNSPYAQAPVEQTSGPIVSLQPDEIPVSVPSPLLVPSSQSQAENLNGPATDISLNQPVRWQATEFIHHEKDAVWLGIFIAVVLAFIAIAIFLLRSPSFAILIPVMAAALLVYTYRQPRVLDYALSRKGLYVNDRLYSFKEFRGFGVIKGAEVGDEYSIMLIPTHRFKPGVYVYFPESSGEAIVDMLAARLPMQDLHLDIIDRVVKKLRL